MQRSKLLLQTGLVAATCLLIHGVANAQTDPTPSQIARAVECFAQDTPIGQSKDKNCGRARLVGYLAPETYSVAVQEQALDRLAQLAISSPDSSVRLAAISLIGYYGAHPRAQASTVDRLAGIYRANSSADVAWRIVQAASINSDSSSAAELLGEVATRRGEDPYHPSIPAQAVTKLHYMGEAGQAVLVSLYNEDRVSDRVGAAMLRSLIAAQP